MLKMNWDTLKDEKVRLVLVDEFLNPYYTAELGTVADALQKLYEVGYEDYDEEAMQDYMVECYLAGAGSEEREGLSVMFDDVAMDYFTPEEIHDTVYSLKGQMIVKFGEDR